MNSNSSRRELVGHVQLLVDDTPLSMDTERARTQEKSVGLVASRQLKRIIYGTWSGDNIEDGASGCPWMRTGSVVT